MMISQPVTVEIKIVDNAIKIMGLEPAVFALASIGVLAVIGIIAYFWWNDYKRNKHIKEAKNCVLLEITPIGGGKVKRVVAPVFKGTAKEVTHTSGATFFITETAKIKESDADGYYLIPGHGWIDEWPYDVPEKQRITILKYYYHENDPFPQMPLEPEKWNKEMVANVTSSFARLSREESVAKTLIGQFSGFFEGLIAALPHLKKLPIMFIILIVQCAGIAAVLYFEFTNGQRLANIAAFLLGGK
jgi:hypothetical protein